MTHAPQTVFLACNDNKVVQTLPQVCLYCGQLSTQVKKVAFSKQPAWGCLLELLAGMFGAAGGSIGEKNVTMQAPVCEEHFMALRRRDVLRWLGLAIMLIPALLFLAADWLHFDLSALLPGISARTLQTIAIGAMIMGVVFIFLVGLLPPRVVRVESIDDSGITLKGVADEFASALVKRN